MKVSSIHAAITLGSLAMLTRNVRGLVAFSTTRMLPKQSTNKFHLGLTNEYLASHRLSNRHHATRRQVSVCYTDTTSAGEFDGLKVNIHTIEKSELETLLQTWGHPKYRAAQILNWVRKNGATSFDEMINLPKLLREDLTKFATIGSLKVVTEQISKDGTIKRAYSLKDGQIIESVLMPYEDGRYTACISSQAGCAMGCVFCATGQMGFARQLTSEEIFEQVALFDAQLKKTDGRVSNVVMMGMGEPLANYRNVMGAVRRMNDELGIGARKITISTVGVVPSIRKLMDEDIQVRLAISLHCATEEERNKLLPANKRYGGLAELMQTVKEYTETSKRRVTFEWALIEGENDTPEVARTLGNLLVNLHGFRRDYVHINVIPLNPTGGFAGSPSGRLRVDAFTDVLKNEFSISATPRVRRGIDIDAGCGQLKSEVEKKKTQQVKLSEITTIASPNKPLEIIKANTPTQSIRTIIAGSKPTFVVDENAYLFDEDDFEDEVWDSPEAQNEVARLMSMVNGVVNTHSLQSDSEVDFESDGELDLEEFEDIELQQEPPLIEVKTTSIINQDAVREAKRRRKKLIKNLAMIEKLKLKQIQGTELNDEQLIKISNEDSWRIELESVEHNMQ